MQVFGYVLQFTGDAVTERILMRLKQLGVEESNLYIDKGDGEEQRKNYQKLKQTVRKGDLVYIDKMASLGLDYEEFAKEWKHFTRTLQASIVVLENETFFDSRKFAQMGYRRDLMEDQFLSLIFYPL